MGEIEKLLKVLDEELTALDLRTDAVVLVWLVLAAVTSQRILQTPKAKPL